LIRANDAATVDASPAAEPAGPASDLPRPTDSPQPASDQAEPTTNPAGERFVALDVFRGLTIAGMILVNNPGSGAHVYGPLEHAAWDGWTPTDLIFPSFLFIVGTSMVFSFDKRRALGADRAAVLGHVLTRSLLIYAVSFFILGPFVPNFLHGRWPNFETIRILGVLPRIALCYLAAAPLVLFTSRRVWLLVSAGLLLGYWALMTLVPVPGHGAGLVASPEWNLAAYIDRWVLGKHIWRGSKLWDPEGILSTLPAIATTLIGALTGHYLRSGRSALEKTAGLFVAGAALLVAGMAWNRLFPINKNLWSSSYVLFSAGFALELLAFACFVIDIRGHRRWAQPLVVFGVNPLAAYVLSTFAAILLYTFDAWDPIYRVGFRSWAGERSGSLAFAVAFLLIWLGVMTVFYRKRIFIRL
jgi:predicted acyltransferase